MKGIAGLILREFHAGLGSVFPYSSRDFPAFESEVRKLTEKLQENRGD